jgi:glucose/arabinose dehydrogenase
MTHSRLTIATIRQAAASLLFAACGGEGPSGPPVIPDLVLDTVATGMSNPLFVTAPPGDRARLFVVERTGQIRIIKNGTLLATPFLDITTQLFSGPEQGILGLAFPPDYATSRYFVVYYVNPDMLTVLSRFHVSSATADTALPGEDTLLSILQPIFPDHNGGMLAYGPDQYLYVSVGDGGCCGDPDGHGQDRTELLGSLLRLDVGSSGAYAIPPDNPWASDLVFSQELWNYGFRNPWRFSFDRVTGDLYIGDVGNDSREEVSVVSGTSPGGENFGWRIMEGGACFGGGTCNMSGLTLPVVDYGHGQGCSVIGGYVYRGNAIPALRGTYFYSDFCFAWIRTFRWVGGVATDQREYTLFDPNALPNSFGEDADGELYVTTEVGNVYKIVAK